MVGQSGPDGAQSPFLVQLCGSFIKMKREICSHQCKVRASPAEAALTNYHDPGSLKTIKAGLSGFWRLGSLGSGTGRSGAPVMAASWGAVGPLLIVSSQGRGQGRQKPAPPAP